MTEIFRRRESFVGLLKSDIVFARSGMPQIITQKDETTGKVSFQNDFEVVKDETKRGVKNGLPEASRVEFLKILESVEDTDKRQEITNLSQKISELKKETKDLRLIRYLEGELGYKMNREKYTPEGFQVDPSAINSY
jgi:hypothetical protein